MNEIKVNTKLTSGIITLNFDEIKKKLELELRVYKGMLFTEDSKKEAKETVAKLRSLQKTIDNRRKEDKKAYMVECDEYEKKMKELCSLADEPINFILAQVEEFEKKRVAERKELIASIYTENIADVMDYLPLSKIYNDKWENSSTNKKAITTEIMDRVIAAQKDIAIIEEMETDSTNKALDLYKRTLSLPDAIQYINRYEQQKNEILVREQKKKEEAEILEAARKKELEALASAVTEQPQIKEVESTVPNNAFVGVDYSSSGSTTPEVSIAPPGIDLANVSKPAKGKTTVYEVVADAFQLAQLESSMREYDIEYRKLNVDVAINKKQSLIKVKFLKDGVIPAGREYTYISNIDVAEGEVIQINESSRGVVTAIDVPEKEVEAFKDKLKTIIGKVEESEEK